MLPRPALCFLPLLRAPMAFPPFAPLAAPRLLPLLALPPFRLPGGTWTLTSEGVGRGEFEASPGEGVVSRELQTQL